MKSEVVREDSKTMGLGKKTTRCEKILKISFQKESPRRRTTSCVQISWNLADWKSVKACFICLTKKKTKNGPALPLSLLCGSRPKSARASCRQYTHERHSDAPRSVFSTRRSIQRVKIAKFGKNFNNFLVCNCWGYQWIAQMSVRLCLYPGM